MIKSLYLRVVLTFSAVVIISVVLSFPIFFMWYTERTSDTAQEALMKAGEQLVTMTQSVPSERFLSILEGSAKLNNSFALTLVDGSGDFKTFGLAGGSVPVPISSKEVDLVLSGKVFKSVYEHFHDPVKMKIGVPLVVDGQTYALFVSPKISLQTREHIRMIVTSVLVIVLIIGSALILIASRYIVNPINKLTLATKTLAAGNFDVHLTEKRSDELGLLTRGFNHMAGKLKQLERMRQDFVSNVSHEIQSPLTSIRGFSKALRRPELGAEERDRYLGIIERESERLSRLSENLLKLASLESEHHPFHPATFDLDEQLRRVVLFFEPQWAEKELEVSLDLPKVKLTADADQINQVWINLIGNAIKFTPPGGRIDVRLTALTDKISVTVQDSGIGIAAPDKEQIFERFYKADTSRERKTEGNGLGLAIVRKIIELHQGFIHVKSEPGQGSEFTVVLPARTYGAKDVRT